MNKEFLIALGMQAKSTLPLLAKILEEMRDTILITQLEPIDGPGPRIVYANAAFTKLMGYTLEELVGKTPRILHGPNTDRGELDKIRAALEARAPVRAELINYTKSGTEINLELEIYPIERTTNSPDCFVAIGRDVSERNRKSEVLKESEERLRLALWGGDIALWDWEFETGKMSVNEQWLTMLGLEKTTPVSIALWASHVHPDDQHKLDEIVHREFLLPGGGRFEAEIRARHADGSYRWMLYRGLVVERAPDGSARRITGTLIDITARKQYEQSLEYSDLLLSRIADAVVSTDANMKILSWNSSAETIYGWTADEAIGQTLDDLLCTEFSGTEQREAQNLLRDGGVWRGEIRQRHRNGSTRLVYATVSTLVDHNGHLVGGVSVNHDISELRKTERQLEAKSGHLVSVMEHIDAVVWEANLTTMDFDYVSDNVGRILGYAEEDFLTRGFWEAHVHPDDRAQAMSARQAIINLGGHNIVYRLRTAAGAVWVKEVAKAHLDGFGRMRIAGLLIDVTEKKTAELAAQDQLEKLRKSQKLLAIGTLAAGIAHDVNTVLATVIANAELAGMDIPEDHAAFKSVEEIRKAALRGRDVVRRILTFSRPQPQEPGKILLAKAISDAVNFLSLSASASIAMTVSVSPVDLAFIGDNTQIQQILVNLLTNSLHALNRPDGQITVLGRWVTRSALGQFENLKIDEVFANNSLAVLIQVIDNGAGMSKDVAERAFEPFFTTKPYDQGTGLGLSIVYGIVQTHGGTILLESVIDGGTTISIVLPASLDINDRPMMCESKIG